MAIIGVDFIPESTFQLIPPFTHLSALILVHTVKDFLPADFWKCRYTNVIFGAGVYALV